MSDRLSVTVSDGLYELVEGIADYSTQTADVPALSKSRVFRLLARHGAQDYVEGDLDLMGTDRSDLAEDALLDLVPKHVRARFMRDEIRDENWLAYMRGGFEDRVRDSLASVFKSDFTAREAREVAEGFKQEARLYWEVLDDEPDVLEAKLTFVDDRVEQYRERRESSTWDPNEEWLTGFAGVEEGSAEDAMDSVRDEVRTVARDRLAGGRGKQEVADSIALVYDLPEEQVREVVDEVSREQTIAEQARAAGMDPSDVPALMPDGTAADSEARAPDADRERAPDGVAVEEDDVAWIEATEAEVVDARADGGEEQEGER